MLPRMIKREPKYTSPISFDMATSTSPSSCAVCVDKIRNNANGSAISAADIACSKIVESRPSSRTISLLASSWIVPRTRPTVSERKTIWSVFPSLRASKGLFGITPSSTSRNDCVLSPSAFSMIESRRSSPKADRASPVRSAPGCPTTASMTPSTLTASRAVANVATMRMRNRPACPANSNSARLLISAAAMMGSTHIRRKLR